LISRENTIIYFLPSINKPGTPSIQNKKKEFHILCMVLTGQSVQLLNDGQMSE